MKLHHWIAVFLSIASPAFGQPVYRELLSAPSDWYVDQLNGNDTNDCTQPTPCKTIQPTLDKLTGKYDFAGTPTLHLLATNGTPTVYRESINLKRWVGNAVYFRIMGDPSNSGAVAVAPQNAHSIVSSHAVGSPWQLESLMVQSSPNYYCIISDAGSHLTVLNMNFGGCGIADMFAEFGGFIETLWDPVFQGHYVISGGAQSHVQVAMGGMFTTQPTSITFLNNPTFIYFVNASLWGAANMGALGAATGSRTIQNHFYYDGTGQIVSPSAGWP